jgi:hypothetical protein
LVYEQAAERLVQFVPELRDAYQLELKWWGSETPGPHVVFEDILNPYIDRLLAADDEHALRRVFAFIEILSTATDTRLQDLVAVAVCEHLGGDVARLDSVRRFVGPATLKILNKVER